jgi:regulator of protease activity HflC (stomatin/prohibitin superfamily)
MGAPVLADTNVAGIVGGSIAGVVVLALFILSITVKVVTEYERAVFFRFGRIKSAAKGPGIITRIPGVDRVVKVNLRVEVIDIPPQSVITADNVTVQVDAVAYFQVIDPVKAIIDELRAVIAASTSGWGVEVRQVQVRDITLPQELLRAMARQAEAERERRAKVIAATGELEASRELSEAADRMAESPGALQLRTLQTLAEVATERNSTLVFPIPVEMLTAFRDLGKK